VQAAYRGRGLEVWKVVLFSVSWRIWRSCLLLKPCPQDTLSSLPLPTHQSWDPASLFPVTTMSVTSLAVLHWNHPHYTYFLGPCSPVLVCPCSSSTGWLETAEWINKLQVLPAPDLSCAPHCHCYSFLTHRTTVCSLLLRKEAAFIGSCLCLWLSIGPLSTLVYWSYTTNMLNSYQF
jgi:hypothetical protein